MSNLKTYLGDSVYAEHDGANIILTTENGVGPSNTIVLGFREMVALKQFEFEVLETTEAEKERNEP